MAGSERGGMRRVWSEWPRGERELWQTSRETSYTQYGKAVNQITCRKRAQNGTYCSRTVVDVGYAERHGPCDALAPPHTHTTLGTTTTTCVDICSSSSPAM